MQLIISGQTPAQKNAKRMAVNRRTGKPFPVTAKAVKVWQDSAAWQLKGIEAIKGKVIIDYSFYCGDNRRRDVDNMIASINDALVKAGIIEDDSWQVLEIGSATGELDREEPRAVIDINAK